MTVVYQDGAVDQSMLDLRSDGSNPDMQSSRNHISKIICC